MKDRANEIYKKVEDLKSIRGRSQDAILAACLYIACRQEDKPRTFKGYQHSYTNLTFNCSSRSLHMASSINCGANGSSLYTNGYFSLSRNLLGCKWGIEERDRKSNEVYCETIGRGYGCFNGDGNNPCW